MRFTKGSNIQQKFKNYDDSICYDQEHNDDVDPGGVQEHLHAATPAVDIKTAVGSNVPPFMHTLAWIHHYLLYPLPTLPLTHSHAHTMDNY